MNIFFYLLKTKIVKFNDAEISIIFDYLSSLNTFQKDVDNPKIAEEKAVAKPKTLKFLLKKRLKEIFK